MKIRAITGFFFIAVLIAAVLLGPYAFILFFSLIATLCAFEFYKMVTTEQTRPLRWFGSFAAFFISGLAGCSLWGHIPVGNLLWIIPFVFTIYLIALFRKTPHPIQDIAYTLTGLIYATLPFLFFMALAFVEGSYNKYIPLGFLILLWTNDTGAYLAGRSFGRTKLFERISPNKTWEGFIGGVVLAVVVALNLEQYFGALQKWEWVTVALIVGVFGTAGDLVESMLKRNLGVKDSGTILPGHGGFLDRFDGLLMAAPLVYLFLKLM